MSEDVGQNRKSIGVKRTNLSTIFPGALGISTELREESDRLNEAIDDLLEFFKNGTAVHASSLAAIEFVAAVKKARGEE